MAQPAQRPHQQQPPQRQQQPHDHQQQQLYYYFPELQAMELQAQPWMVATISIDDDDLTFGGKPLSTLYEEDRRRYSVGEESLPSSPSPSSHGSSEEDEEEERRGRQRVSSPSRQRGARLLGSAAS